MNVLKRLSCFDCFNVPESISVFFKMTDLHNAIQKGNLEHVRSLINAGADVNTKDKAGNIPLHFSAAYGHVNIVKTLIYAGSNINAKNECGRVPLHYSAVEHHLNVVEILIAAGADVKAKDKDGITPIHLSDNVEVVKALIAAGADVNAKDEYESTPLHRSDNAEVVKVLIAAGADVNAKKKPPPFFVLNPPETPLHCCYNVEKAKLLIAAGADVNAKAQDGKTTLYYYDDVQIVEALIVAGADVNAKDEKENTPLHCTYNIEVVELLIAAGADVNAKNYEGKTPLHRWRLAYEGKMDIVKALVAAGADINMKDSYEMTPLGRASIFYREEACKFLIKHGMLYTHSFEKPNFEHNVGKINKLWNTCEEQVKKLKETYLNNSYVSFFKFLTETDENKIALYSSEENFGLNNELERAKYIEIFPWYADDVEAQFIKGSKRAHLLHQTQELMKAYFCKDFPIEIIRIISEHLKNDDLENFLASHKFDKNTLITEF